MSHAQARFYDREPLIANAIELLQVFPGELQNVVARALSLLAIKDFGAEARMAHFKSLGTETILPLYKSKNKQRRYDQHPHFHNAINYLRILSPEERATMAIKVVNIAGYAEHYLGLCAAESIQNQCKAVANIRDVYIALGADEAKQYMLSVCGAFLACTETGKTLIGTDGSSLLSS